MKGRSLLWESGYHVGPKLHEKSFILIEIAVVVAILAVLGAVPVPKTARTGTHAGKAADRISTIRASSIMLGTYTRWKSARSQGADQHDRQRYPGGIRTGRRSESVSHCIRRDEGSLRYDDALLWSPCNYCSLPYRRVWSRLRFKAAA